MDKIKKYQDVIIDFLNRYNAETGRSLEDTIKRRILVDREHNSFQLLSTGWRGRIFKDLIGFLHDLSI